MQIQLARDLGRLILLVSIGIVVVFVIPALAGVVIKDGPPGGSRLITQDLHFATWGLPSTTPPADGELGGLAELTTRNFDDTTDETIAHVIKVPSNYLNGHDVTYSIAWNSAAATTGAACWCILTAQVTSADQLDPAAADNTDCAGTTTAGVAGNRNITEITAGGSDMVLDDYLTIQLKRDGDGGLCTGADDLAGDGVVAGVYLTYRAHH